jgi:branched-chain amino acid transport system substrate-binding protein
MRLWPGALHSLLFVASITAVAVAADPAASAEKPIKVGMTNHLTGTAALYARSQVDAVELAIAQWNERGGVLGRPLELIVRDDQLRPDLGVSHARDLVLREEVDVLLGPGSSGVAVAVSPIAKQYGKVLMLTTSNSPRLTMELFHPYVFQVAPTGLMEPRALAEELGPQYDKWGYIAGDYEASHQYLRHIKDRLAQVNPAAEIVVEAWPKLGSPDFTPYITQLLAAEPEIVYSGLWGADLVAFIKQAQPYGLFDKTQFMTILVVDDLRGMGEEMPEGIIGQMRAPFFAIDNPRMNEFVEQFRAKTGEYPSDWAVQGYEGLDILAHAIENAGSTDSDAIVEALENITYEGLRGTIRFRQEDHQGTVPSFIGRTVESDEYPFLVIEDVKVVPAEAIWPSLEEIAASRQG